MTSSGGSSVQPEGNVRSVSDRVAMLLATALGTGYGPFAPGSWGSLPGLALAFALARLGGNWAIAGGIVVVSLVGVWAAGRVEALVGEKDPGIVVIDEVAGQMVTLLFVGTTPRALMVGFFFFRLTDTLKPWPARRFEDLPGGSGIMADDLMAGVYANLILQGIALWHPAWLGLA